MLFDYRDAMPGLTIVHLERGGSGFYAAGDLPDEPRRHTLRVHRAELQLPAASRRLPLAVRVRYAHSRTDDVVLVERLLEVIPGGVVDLREDAEIRDELESLLLRMLGAEGASDAG